MREGLACMYLPYYRRDVRAILSSIPYIEAIKREQAAF